MLMTFLLGLLAFVAWACAMGLKARSIGILKTSALYFGVGSLLAAFPLAALHLATTGFGYPALSAWATLITAVFFEEILKLLASLTQKHLADAFAITSLFGIYELMLVKPLVMIVNGDWSIGFHSATLLVLPALSFHILTAALYSFIGRDRPVRQLVICIGFHTAFNAFAYGLIFPTVPALWFVLLSIPLAATTLLIWRGRAKDRPSVASMASTN